MLLNQLKCDVQKNHYMSHILRLGYFDVLLFENFEIEYLDLCNNNYNHCMYQNLLNLHGVPAKSLILFTGSGLIIPSFNTGYLSPKTSLTY